MQNQQAITILTAIRHVKSVYMKCRFEHSTLLMDDQFESIQGDLAEMQTTLNKVSSDKHVPEV